jgi:hypothetical protein
MTVRPTIIRDQRNPTDSLPTGYDPGATVPTDFTIPPCGIGDVDEASFYLFEKELGFATKELNVNGENAAISIKKPSVIFSAGERFAIVKKLRPIRDINKGMMLPSISIHRTSVKQDSSDIMGRGRNQMTGEMVIKRKLDDSDKDYQLFLNKLLLKNLDTTSGTRRETGELVSDPAIKQGMLLDPKFGNNIYEILTIPAPQYFTATYEVIFWTQYMEHMNYLIETLFSGFLPQGKIFKITCDKGYWFIAYVEDEFRSQDNFEDFTGEKRILRYSFNMNVKGFILAANGPGNAVPMRRYFSAPTISFEISETPDQIVPVKNLDAWKREDNSPDDFLLTDIEADKEKEQTPTTTERFKMRKEITDSKTGKTVVKYVKMSDQNVSKAETVYKASDTKTLQEFLFPSKR